MMDTDDLPQQDLAAPSGVPPSAKLLLRAVYIMGIVLVLLFLALVGGIIWKSTRKASTINEIPPVLDLALTTGSRVESMALDGDRLAINTGQEIIVVDLRKNAVISRLSTIPK